MSFFCTEPSKVSHLIQNNSRHFFYKHLWGCVTFLPCLLLLLINASQLHRPLYLPPRAKGPLIPLPPRVLFIDSRLNKMSLAESFLNRICIQHIHVLCSLLDFWHLEGCVAYSRCTINVCWMNNKYLCIALIFAFFFFFPMKLSCCCCCFLLIFIYVTVLGLSWGMWELLVAGIC